MAKDDLLRLIANTEDNFIERKQEDVRASELRQTICVFANSVPAGREAVHFIGIHDKTGAVMGVTNPDEQQKRLREASHRDY
jgi:predicted HTH transcriptional regulator